MQNIWNGRFDGESEEYLRIFQKVDFPKDYQNILSTDFALHGFAVDEGVKRNKGRVGAKNAPDIIRKNMSNFPIQRENFRLLDFGNIYCEDEHLENSQNKLAENIEKVLLKNAKSLVLGGGHEVTFAHYSGIRKAFPNAKIGIINFDAHFDNREPDPKIGPSSGTGFWQIAQEGNFQSLHIGIQKNSNTKKLFQTAEQFGMEYIMSDALFHENIPQLLDKIDDFISKVDVVYLTICMDVFNAAIAPGVSAAAYNGIFADITFLSLYRHILKHKKMMALDVAEVNPEFDIQERTARLAASLANEWLMI
ncbi:MAG: formimidoylglutamase [Bacteroidetes bacterium]|nr:formimidoylglutamase [Bacteroidota bacterium]